MAVAIEQLVRQLWRRRSDLDEWIVVEQDAKRYRRDVGGREARSHAERRGVTIHGFHDSERGRGSASVTVPDSDFDIGATVTELVAGSRASAGPLWKLPPPAAPARVEVGDAAVTAGPDQVIDAIADQLGGAAPAGLAVARASIFADVITRRAVTSHGFDSRYTATRVTIDAVLVGASGAEQPVSLSVGRAADLDLAKAMERAGRLAVMGSEASPVPSGTYDLVLPPQAMGMQGGGILAPFIAQADGTLVRQGLSRYRVGQPVFADAGGKHISLSSDGTTPYAEMTAPFGELGEPVRRFDLIVNGVAAGVSYSLREAALARVTPNGGTRTLVLATGDASPNSLLVPSDGRAVLQAHDIAWVDADPASGQLTVGVGLASLIDASGPRPVSGAICIGNAFTWLARATLSSERAAWGRYLGPSHIRIGSVHVVGEDPAPDGQSVKITGSLR